LIRPFAPPVFADPEQTLRARIVYLVIVFTGLIAVSFLPLIGILQPAAFSRAALAAVSIAGLSLALLRLNRAGRTQLAAAGYAGGLIVLMTAMAVTAGGVRSPGVTMYFVLVMMVGLLLGRRAGTVTALICAALGLGLLLAERAGLLPPGIRYSSTTIWLLSCLYMSLVILLLRLPTMLIETAVLRAEENQQLLQTMIENTPAAVAMFDTEMRYMAYSRRWLADYRLGNRELKGLGHYEVFPEIGEDWKAIHRRCLAGARETREEESFPRGDGTEDIVRWAVQPWRKGNGDIGGLTMFTEVITDRVRAREERRSLADQLLQAQKIEALGTLAGGIAHDFNNLLAMIGTNAELGLTDGEAGDNARTAFDEIVKATTRAKDLVGQILLFSRRQDSSRDTISVLPIVEDALTFLRATLPATVELRATLDRGVPRVSANASQIYQILMNLGTNAGHAMHAGGVLSVGLDCTDVTTPEATACGVLHKGEYVRVIVQDTGTGMSRETLDRIFEPFFTTKGLEGTGLGLSVVHGLVKDHGGAVTVESAPGQGSTFRVYLPAARGEPANPPLKEGEPAHGKGEHFLYIDDEPSLGSAMGRVLKVLGYRCTSYSDPAAALEAFAADPDQFDAVISDMTMPFLSGFDVVKELHAIRPELPIALTSGRTSQSTHTFASSLGIKTWIPKPATIDELSHALELLLTSARKNRRSVQ